MLKRLILIFFVCNVLGFALLSHRCSGDGIEGRLEAIVKKEVEAASEYRRVRYETRDLDLVLTGHVPTGVARRELLEGINKELPFGRVRSSIEIVPPVPASLRATLGEGIMRLEGKLPSKSMIQSLQDQGREIGFSVLGHGLISAENVVEPAWASGVGTFVAEFFADADEGFLEIDDTKWHVRRQVDTPEQAQEIRETVRLAVPQSLALIDEISIRPPDQPSQLTVERVGGTLVVSGKVPGEAHRAFVAKAVSETLQENISNEISLDRKTKPPTWMTALPGILSVLFDQGKDQKLEISGTEIRLSGQLATKEEIEELMLVAGSAFGPGFVVENAFEAVSALRPPPPHLECKVKSSNESITLMGIVPDAIARDLIIGAFQRSYPKAGIESSGLKTDSRVEAPIWFEGFLQLVSTFPVFFEMPPSLSVAEKKIDISGKTNSRISHAAVGMKLDRLFGDRFSVENRTTEPSTKVPDHDDWPRRAIYFEMGSSRVSSTQAAGIEEAGLDFQKAGEFAVVLIEGFADKSGSREVNLAVGSRRAHAVRDSLIAQGIPSSSIRMMGVTIAESSSNPDRDRRVEFTVVP
tara:strand:+ start:11161 stop:12903 length:1743 start_codon:yes stop_codon:yes gene_type:complete